MISDGAWLLPVLEPVCFAILAVWLVLRFRAERTASDKRALALELVTIAVAAFIGEATCVRLYGFYAYASVWRVFIDVVPLAVVCIWPVVIRSLLDLLRPLAPRPHLRAALLAVLVAVDASLIEPISVAAGLWWWTEPGPFLVPVIGVVGWGFFALGCGLCVKDDRVSPWAVLVAPLLTHALLLASWWGAFKHLSRMQNEGVWVVLAWIGSACVAVWFLRSRAPPLLDVMLRAPAAAFFFLLLALFARTDTALVLYAVAFAPPWLVLVFRSARPARAARVGPVATSGA